MTENVETVFEQTDDYNPAIGMVVFIKAPCPNETMSNYFEKKGNRGKICK